MAISKYPTSIPGLPKSSISLAFSTNTPNGRPSNVANSTDFTYDMSVPAGAVVIQSDNTSLRIYPGAETTVSGDYYNSAQPYNITLDTNATSVSSITVAVPSAWRANTTFASSSVTVTSVAGTGDYVIVGMGAATALTGRVNVSTNGTTWTVRTLGTASGDAAYALDMYDGTYYYVGNASDGYIWVSTSTASWTTRLNIGPAYTGGLYNANAPYKYVIYSNQNAGLFISTDGTTWTTRNTAGSSINQIVWATPYYLGVTTSGNIILSTDGLNWATRAGNTGGNNLISVVAKPPYYYAFTQSTVRISTNFTTWASNSFTPFSGSANAVIYDGSNYMVVVGGGDEVLKSSTDGINWVTRSIGLTASYQKGTYTNSTRGWFVFKAPSSGNTVSNNAIVSSGFITSLSSVKFDSFGSASTI